MVRVAGWVGVEYRTRTDKEDHKKIPEDVRYTNWSPPPPPPPSAWTSPLSSLLCSLVVSWVWDLLRTHTRGQQVFDRHRPQLRHTGHYRSLHGLAYVTCNKPGP